MLVIMWLLLVVGWLVMVVLNSVFIVDWVCVSVGMVGVVVLVVSGSSVREVRVMWCRVG